MNGPSRLQVGDLSFRVLDAGEGDAVLLLHGFPDSLELWRHQVPALADAGFRVIAPDLRGFGQSDRPEGVEAYALPTLLGDVVGILDHLGVERANVVGHDWGAGLAWAMAGFLADRVERLVALSLGHPSGYFSDMAQRERSWYMLFILFPGVAEEVLPRDGWKLFRELARGEGDLERYIADLSRPGALTAALNWYRANITPESFVVPGQQLPPAQCPTLGVWGNADHYCLEPQMLASAEHVKGPWRYERLEGAGHWIPLDAPEQLNELLVDFLGSTVPA